MARLSLSFDFISQCLPLLPSVPATNAPLSIPVAWYTSSMVYLEYTRHGPTFKTLSWLIIPAKIFFQIVTQPNPSSFEIFAQMTPSQNHSPQNCNPFYLHPGTPDLPYSSLLILFPQNLPLSSVLCNFLIYHVYGFMPISSFKI